jgi:hypothetical protein
VPLTPQRPQQARSPLEGIVRAKQRLLQNFFVGFRAHPFLLFYMQMNVEAEQARRLEQATTWAQKIRSLLSTVIEQHRDRVHFRPSSTGVSMINLSSSRPQRGKSGFTNIERLARDFEALFQKHCVDIDQGRETGEKALQSVLIRDAYTHGRVMHAINVASLETTAPVELTFVTDEISLPVEGGTIVCDLLALRRDGPRTTPVLLELKDRRMLSRLVEQVERYAKLIDTHADLFARLSSELLGTKVKFDAPTEKWIVWPGPVDERDPREAELATRGIRLVTYTLRGEEYRLRVGSGAA